MAICRNKTKKGSLRKISWKNNLKLVYWMFVSMPKIASNKCLVRAYVPSNCVVCVITRGPHITPCGHNTMGSRGQVLPALLYCARQLSLSLSYSNDATPFDAWVDMFYPYIFVDTQWELILTARFVYSIIALRESF